MFQIGFPDQGKCVERKPTLKFISLIILVSLVLLSGSANAVGRYQPPQNCRLGPTELDGSGFSESEMLRPASLCQVNQARLTRLEFDRKVARGHRWRSPVIGKERFAKKARSAYPSWRFPVEHVFC